MRDKQGILCYGSHEAENCMKSDTTANFYYMRLTFALMCNAFGGYDICG